MNNATRSTYAADGRLQRFAIITAYSMAVLFATGYIPGAQIVLGLGL